MIGLLRIQKGSKIFEADLSNREEVEKLHPLFLPKAVFATFVHMITMWDCQLRMGKETVVSPKSQHQKPNAIVRLEVSKWLQLVEW